MAPAWGRKTLCIKPWRCATQALIHVFDVSNALAPQPILQSVGPLLHKNPDAIFPRGPSAKNS
jgi:hypothetical protein